MKTMIKMMLLASTVMMTSCLADDPFSDGSNNWDYSWDDNGSTTTPGSGSSSTTTGELTTFSVSIDQTSAEPTTTTSEYLPDEEDALENNSFTTEVNIDMSNPTAFTENGVEVTVNGGHITANHSSTKNICYVLSGTTTNGSFTVVGDKKYEVKLNNVNITNPDSAALNLLSGKRAYIMLVDGTSNTLSDGTGGSQKGALYCKGKLLFNGSGKLSVTGNTNNAIHSADYIVFRKGNNIYANSTANHGIKANDGIFINGGIINVEVSAEAAKGINCESNIIVNGGRTTVITTGGADSAFTINAGELWLKSTGSGGKGINVDTEANFTGGNVYIVTEGGQYKSNNDTSSPKGIKADGNINISGGAIWVRTNGYNGEGIETKSAMNISGGEVASYAYDDAINSKGDMTITGGYVYAQGKNNDGLDANYVYAQGKNNDGLDANGNIYIKGGLIYAICSGSPEVAIDANTEGGKKLYLTGGTVVAVGGLENGSSLSQACYQASSWSKNTWYTMTYDSNTFSFKTPSSGGSGLVVSSAATPTLSSGTTISGGSSVFGGIGIMSGSVSNGTSVSQHYLR